MVARTTPVAAPLPHHAVLLAGCRAQPDPDSLARLGETACEISDWESVLDLARYNRVLPLLATNLLTVETAAVRIRADLEAEIGQVVLRNLSLVTQLDGLLRLLHQHEIAGAAWKGPALAAIAYGSLGARASADLDILVDPAALRRAVSLLLSHGYVVVNEHERRRIDGLFPPAGDAYTFCSVAGSRALVDLHRRVWSWPLALALDSHAVLARSSPRNVGDRSVLTLSPEDHLLAVAAHATHHDWGALTYVCDIDALARQPIDWDGVLRGAREARMGRILRTSLLLAQGLLDTQLPPAVVAEAERDRGAGQLARELADRLFAPARWPRIQILKPWSTIRLRSHEGARERAAYVVREALADWVLKVPCIRRIT